MGQWSAAIKNCFVFSTKNPNTKNLGVLSQIQIVALLFKDVSYSYFAFFFRKIVSKQQKLHFQFTATKTEHSILVTQCNKCCV